LILFYVQHLLGIGHLRRTLAIAQACLEEGLDVRVVSGGIPVKQEMFKAVRVHQLPPVKSADLSFSSIVDQDGLPVTSELEQRRADKLLRIFSDNQPSVLVTELFPFGRRRFRFEIMPLLKEAKKTGTKVVCSVRDSVQIRSNQREDESLDVLHQFYDEVLVHGDPEFLPFEASFAKASSIKSIMGYTGLVDTNSSYSGQTELRKIDGASEILVSAGGGAAGEKIYRAASRACALSQCSRPWRLLLGSNPAERLKTEIKMLGGDKVIVEANRSDFRQLLSQCAISISQVGYNTVVDLLATGAPAIVIPFEGEGGQSEQSARAKRLESMGRARVLSEETVSAERLCDLVSKMTDANPSRFPRETCNGAKNSARALTKYFE
jgi:predicted glycosyltransferase